MAQIAELLEDVIGRYQASFSRKVYQGENEDTDPLMDVFSITPQLKRENRQYWGRELGMCWQLLVIEVFQHFRSDFGPALRFDSDEPCDLTVGNIAIDTKYRIGSGDSGTLRKFRQYGELLQQEGYTPVFLIVREDNLRAALRACSNGGWTVYTGNSTFEYIREQTGFDLKEFLTTRGEAFDIQR